MGVEKMLSYVIALDLNELREKFSEQLDSVCRMVQPASAEEYGQRKLVQPLSSGWPVCCRADGVGEEMRYRFVKLFIVLLKHRNNE